MSAIRTSNSCAPGRRLTGTLIAGLCILPVLGCSGDTGETAGSESQNNQAATGSTDSSSDNGTATDDRRRDRSNETGNDTSGEVDAGRVVEGEVNFPPGPPEIALAPEAPTTMDTLTVSLVADAVDPDGGPETVTHVYRWFRFEEETLHASDSIPPEVTARGEVWRVEVRGFDGLAEGTVAELEVEIVNTPPFLEDVRIEPAEADPNAVLKCEVGTRTDVDDDDVSVTYQWYKDDVPVDDAVSSAFNPPLDAGVRYRCRAKPSDGVSFGDVVWSFNEVIPEEVLISEALINFQPKSLDLGTVLPNETNTVDLTIHNIGAGDLEIYDFSLSGDTGFGLEATLPIMIPAGGTEIVQVTFSTDTPGLKKGNVSFETNAFNAEKASVPLLGIGAAPCLQVKPGILDFGGAYIPSIHMLDLELLSCGAMPVTIDSIALTQASGSPFSLDLSVGPGELPWVIEPTESSKLKVRFEPTSPSEVSDDGTPVFEENTLSISSSELPNLIQVPISGFASDTGCPVPVVKVAEGHYAAEGTLLHLDATDSLIAGGGNTIYSWGVSRPEGASDEVELQPSSSEEIVTYQLDEGIFGEYVFSLKVFDESDGDVVSGCGTAEWSVTVKDAIPLIIELVWDTPGDADQQDTGPGEGADLDLHMHDGQGAGSDYDGDGVADAWFDFVHDVYWFDTSPDWGESGSDDDPILTIEDADGSGPERIEFHVPINGYSYVVGVHAWSSYDYGPSVATIKIYHFESLVETATDVLLVSGEFWEVGTLSWPSAELTLSVGSEGGPKVTAGYPNPFQ